MENCMNQIMDLREDDGILFDNLRIGNCFMSNDILYMKIWDNGLYASVRLKDGRCEKGFYGQRVQKVNITINCYNATQDGGCRNG